MASDPLLSVLGEESLLYIDLWKCQQKILGITKKNRMRQPDSDLQILLKEMRKRADRFRTQKFPSDG